MAPSRYKTPYYWQEEVLERSRLINTPPRPQTQYVDIVFASDKNFLPYTNVALASVLESYDSKIPLRINILTDKYLSEDDLNRFENLKHLNDFILNIIVVDGSSYAQLRTTPGISVATYYRLQMHNLLPADCCRVVYLDSDIIVKKSVHDLFMTDLGDNIIGGVEDSVSKHYVEKLGQHPETIHINAGVIVIDIDKIRKINFDDACSSFISAKRYTLMLGDQQIITGILGLVTLPLPIRWNVHGSMFDGSWAAKNAGTKNNMSLAECMEAAENPSIIHYTYHRKPWISPDHPKSNEWFSALRLSPYRFSNITSSH
ncbi:glycosyltransferase family 8 protein [Brevundimonas nasdae]|uniref:glycosyltransferase family 8 protein n=1 Tax=Brevundimonas nasdae TaxID=172043 RepID=UPI003F68EEE3